MKIPNPISSKSRYSLMRDTTEVHVSLPILSHSPYFRPIRKVSLKTLRTLWATLKERGQHQDTGHATRIRISGSVRVQASQSLLPPGFPLIGRILESVAFSLNRRLAAAGLRAPRRFLPPPCSARFSLPLWTRPHCRASAHAPRRERSLAPTFFFFLSSFLFVSFNQSHCLLCVAAVANPGPGLIWI